MAHGVRRTPLGSAPVTVMVSTFVGVILAEERAWAIAPHSAVPLGRGLEGRFRQTRRLLKALPKVLAPEFVLTSIVGVLGAPYEVGPSAISLGKLGSISESPKLHSVQRFESLASVFADP